VIASHDSRDADIGALSRFFDIEHFGARIAAGARRAFAFFASKGWHYWAIAAAVLALSVYLTPRLDDWTVNIRYALFQRFSEWTAHPLKPRFIKIVMIGDEEYYRGEPAERVPLSRDYLAKLVDALDRADAAVIALDFQMQLPDGNAKGTPGDYAEIPAPYRDETATLMRAIAHAAQSRAIVLPKKMTGPEPDGYRMLPDYFQPYGICTKLKPNGQWDNPGTREFPLTAEAQRHISCGYISLPKDKRQIAPSLDVGQAAPADSFSLAIARAWSPYDAQDIGDEPAYGSYISEKALDKAGAIVPAGALLAGDPSVLDRLRFKPVLVGADWHISGFNLGDKVDRHFTPIGWTNGAIIHENFAEAILSGRLYSGTPDWLLHALEILFGVFAAILFAAYSQLWVKIALFFGLAVFLFAVQWLMFQLVGTFFEAIFPLLGLAIHSIVERLIE
jgi:hypothetical protein